MTGIDDAYKKYQQVNLQKQAEAIRTGQSQTITSNDIGPIRSESASDREAAMKDEATRKIATNAYVRAQNDAMAEALSTGKPVELTQSRVNASKEKVIDNYTTSRTPDLTIIGPGGKDVIPGTRTISVPVGEAEARNKALTAGYASYQKQNLDLQKQYLDERAKAAEAAKKNANVEYHKVYSVNLEDRLSGGPYGYQVNLNDKLSGDKESQEQKKPADPLGDLYQGTVGSVGEFLAGGMRAFYEKIGYKDVGERGAKHFEDLLGIDRKNPPVGGGSLVIGAGTSALAKATGDTARAKTEDANVDYAEKYAQEHPIGFGAATAIDILPALFGAKLGKGGNVEAVAPKPSGSKFVQRAYADEAPAPAIKPAGPPVDNVSLVEVKPIAASKPVGGTFENSPVNLGSGLLKDISIPAAPKPFVNESVALGAGSIRLTQVPEFKNVSIDLGASSSTGLGKVGGSSGGGGSKPSGGNGGNFIPSQSIKPGDFGFKETKGSDGTVTLQKVEDLTTIKPQKPVTTSQKPTNSIESLPQKSDTLRTLLGQDVKAKSRPAQTKNKPADTQALQSLINPVVQTSSQKRKQKVEQKVQTTQILQVQEAPTHQQTQDLGISLAVRQTALQEIQGRVKTKRKPSTMSGFAIPQPQTTRTIPTQGSRQVVTTIPKLDIPNLTRTVPDNPFIRIPTNRPPPPRTPPTRTPPPPDMIKLPPLPKLEGGGLGLTFGRRGKIGKSDVDALGVSNILYPAFSISEKPSKGALKRHGSGGMFSGLPKISEKSAGLLAPFKEKKDGRRKKGKFTLF